MNKLILAFLLVFSFTGRDIFAQDTLPRFSLRNVGNKRIVVEWINRFENIKQISIQRSADSLRNFKTILTIADPRLPENGYLDTKAPTENMFYRLYIMLDKGVFLFSETKRPVLDTVVAKRGVMVKPDNPVLVHSFPADSLANSPIITNNNRPKTETWVPSKFVYTLKDGYIRIALPDEPEKKYNIKFFTIRDEFLFELKEIKEKNFKIDKANFYRAGWFKFELYEDDTLKEKNRFYLPREF
jgi:hypothetical protein